MGLAPGTSIGHYDVTSLLGEGGMGQVWQATDTQLNRQVALKILPDAFAADPDRLARFKREAQILASLNHSNIAAIYGIEEAEGTRALVLELVEGPTLADRIAKGPIPLDEALPIAKQIAEALEAAHEAGVIHRDLKPANIKVREDGTVKVLDFGLAKALDPNPEGDPSQSPTLTAAATQMGVIMGTAAYMSPEQARGKPVDKRADIWSFGVVLFEMLTRRHLFEGQTVSHVLGAVLQVEPSWDALPASTPSSVKRLLRLSLQKEPKRRLPDIGVVRLELDETEAAPVRETREEAPSIRLGVAWWQAGVAALVVGMVSGLSVWILTPTPASPVSRFTIPVDGLATDGLSTTLALSPDGRTVVYAALPEGSNTRLLYQRSFAQLEASSIRGSEQGEGPFFSPDGQSLGFWSFNDALLKRVSLAGGPPTTLTSVNDFRWASWGPGGSIVFAGGGTHEGLWLVSEAGGDARQVASVEGEGVLRYINPQFLPDGSAVLFTIVSADGPPQVAVLSLDTGEHRVLLEGTGGVVATTGHLLFAREDSLWAVPLSADGLEVVGEPAPMLEQVQPNSDGVARMAIGDDGTLVYVKGPAGAAVTQRVLVWVDDTGREDALSLPPRNYLDPRVSPDGRRVAVSVRDDDGRDLWVFDAVSAAGIRLSQGFVARSLVWTPDGSRVVFFSSHESVGDIYTVQADGSGEPELLLQSAAADFLTSVSPDGHTLVFTRLPDGPSTPHREIWEVVVDGSEPARPILQGDFERGNAEISPDGNWLVYRSDQSGTMEVYVQPYPGPGPVVPVSIGGGNQVMWSPDGSRLLYRLEDQMMGVLFVPADAVEIGSPTSLFEGTYVDQPGGIRQHHVAPDGRFLMIRAAGGRDDDEDQVQPQIVLVQNWFQELLERVPLP